MQEKLLQEKLTVQKLKNELEERDKSLQQLRKNLHEVSFFFFNHTRLDTCDFLLHGFCALQK